MLPRGATPWFQIANLRRDAQLSDELWALLRSWRDSAKARSAAAWDRYGPDVRTFSALLYPGISSSRLHELLHWLHEPYASKPGINLDSGSTWGRIAELLTEPEQFPEFAEYGGSLHDRLFHEYARRFSGKLALLHGRRGETCTDAAPICTTREAPTTRYWSSSAGAPADTERRRELVYTMLESGGYMGDCIWQDSRDVFDRLVAEAPELFEQVFRDRFLSNYTRGSLVARLWERRYPIFPAELLLAALGNSGYLDSGEIVQAIIKAEPGATASLTSAQLTTILLMLDAASLRLAASHIGPSIAGSGSKALRESLTKAFAQLPPAALTELGWLQQKQKNLRLACRDILMAHPDPAALSLLAELYASGSLDAASASEVRAHLDARGHVVPDIPAGKANKAGKAAAATGDPLTDAEAEAAAVKRLSSKLQSFETPELLADLRPLSEHAARVVLHLAATAEKGLPPLAAALLAHVPAENRARFALGAGANLDRARRRAEIPAGRCGCCRATPMTGSSSRWRRPCWTGASPRARAPSWRSRRSARSIRSTRSRGCTTFPPHPPDARSRHRGRRQGPARRRRTPPAVGARAA